MLLSSIIKDADLPWDWLTEEQQKQRIEQSKAARRAARGRK